MTDNELFILRHTQYASIKSDARAAEALAYALGLSVDSVRGRLSRAKSPSNWLKVAEILSESNDQPGVQRQEAVFKRSAQRWEQRPQEGAALFLSDIHIPYTRWDVMDVVFQIMQDIPNLRFVSVANDLHDNEGYGRWDDDTRFNAWASDISHARRAEAALYRSILSAAPDAWLLQLNGNHDLWIMNFLRTHTKGMAETIIAEYVEWLEQQGVLVWSSTRENHIQIAPDTIWWHGQFVSKSIHTNAKNTLGQFMQRGKAYSVIVGHTHRPGIVEGYEVQYDGVRFINSGCLRSLTDIPYMKRNPKGWGWAVVLTEFGNGSSEHELIRIHERGSYVYAQFRGRTYRSS